MLLIILFERPECFNEKLNAESGSAEWKIGVSLRGSKARFNEFIIDLFKI